MWLGESTHTLDSKNRVFLPKRFQDGLDRDEQGNLTAILTRGFESCLFLHSRSGFQRVLDRLRTEPFAGARARLMQRLFFASSHPVTLDASGRLLLPEKLKQLAGIDRELAMIGAVDRIELWALDAWRKLESEHGQDFDQLDRVLLGSDGSAPSAPNP